MTLETESFSALHEWVEKFKNRYRLETHTLSGESASVNKKIVEQWKKGLSSLVKGYKAKDIFNHEEAGLLFKMMPKEKKIGI